MEEGSFFSRFGEGDGFEEPEGAAVVDGEPAIEFGIGSFAVDVGAEGFELFAHPANVVFSNTIIKGNLLFLFGGSEVGFHFAIPSH